MTQHPRGHNQDQFLEVLDPDLAKARWYAALAPTALATENVALANLRGRVLAQAVAAPGDVPGFDRSNVDGYAVCASDTYGASEAQPVRLHLGEEVLATGIAPQTEVRPGLALAIATGGMIPRGANAVVMLEDCDLEANGVLVIRRPAIPGAMISFAGSDITRGEVVLRAGTVLTARDTGVLAAIGVGTATVVRRPKVGILSTGDEIVAPGQPLAPAHIYDCNQTVLADTCEELGCEALRLGIVGDCDRDLQAELTRALDQGCDLILLSGGTSKGAGDRSYRAVAALPGPGPECASIVVHGVALKPGKPLCLAATRHRGRVVPIAVLPGFPSSALFTFHGFCGPLLEILGGRHRAAGGQCPATLAHNAASVRGRQQYMLVQLNRSAAEHSATPSRPVAQVLAKGSGSISAFCRADGFITVPAQQERLEAGEEVTVTPLARNLAPADLVIVGSHCTGLEQLAEQLHSEGIRVRLVAVGSQAGLRAARDALCDIAPVHLYDPKTCSYNKTFVPPGCTLLRGYGRMQGLLFRTDDRRFDACQASVSAWFESQHPLADGLVLVNRNRGSGTRILIDELLASQAPKRPRGYHHEARSHSGVATCVASGRADWGVAIAPVARAANLGFAAIRAESYDFVIPDKRRSRPPVARFIELLHDPSLAAALLASGFLPSPEL